MNVTTVYICISYLYNVEVFEPCKDEDHCISYGDGKRRYLPQDFSDSKCARTFRRFGPPDLDVDAEYERRTNTTVKKFETSASPQEEEETTTPTTSPSTPSTTSSSTTASPSTTPTTTKPPPTKPPTTPPPTKPPTKPPPTTAKTSPSGSSNVGAGGTQNAKGREAKKDKASKGEEGSKRKDSKSEGKTPDSGVRRNETTPPPQNPPNSTPRSQIFASSEVPPQIEEDLEASGVSNRSAAKKLEPRPPIVPLFETNQTTNAPLRRKEEQVFQRMAADMADQKKREEETKEKEEDAGKPKGRRGSNSTLSSSKASNLTKPSSVAELSTVAAQTASNVTETSNFTETSSSSSNFEISSFSEASNGTNPLLSIKEEKEDGGGGLVEISENPEEEDENYDDPDVEIEAGFLKLSTLFWRRHKAAIILFMILVPCLVMSALWVRQAGRRAKVRIAKALVKYRATPSATASTDPSLDRNSTADMPMSTLPNASLDDASQSRTPSLPIQPSVTEATARPLPSPPPQPLYSEIAERKDGEANYGDVDEENDYNANVIHCTIL